MRIIGPLSFCSRGGIGRRVRLRTVWGNPWRFESSREQRPDYLPAPFLLAAHRAFINWESRLLPAAVIPLLRRRIVRPGLRPAFCLAQRARAAAASFARVAADILRRPARLPRAIARGAAELPISEFKRRSRLSICRRIETASSKFLRDKSMRRLLPGVR